MIIKNNILRYLDVSLLYSSFALLAVLMLSTALVTIISSIILILFIIRIIIDRHTLAKHNYLEIPILIFILFKVISVFTSISFENSLPVLYKEIPFYFLIFAFIYTFKNNFNHNLLVITRIILFSSLLASLIGISGFISGLEPRATSIVSGYTTLGIFLTVSLAYLLFISDDKRIFKKPFYWYVSMIIIITGILFTLNRTHWIGIVLLILIYSIYKKQYILPVSLILIFILLLFVYPDFRVRISQLLFLFDNMSGRNSLWKGAVQLIYDRPLFGFGPNTFKLIFPFQSEMGDKLVSSWHNDYIQLYLDSGIFALASFFWIIILTYKKGIQTFRKISDKSEGSYLLALIASISVFIFLGGSFDYLCGILFKCLISTFVLYNIYITNKITEVRSQ